MSEPYPKSTDTHRMMICPGCEKEIKVLNEYLGLKIECTLCGKRFKARILDDEKRRAQRAQRVKAAIKWVEANKADLKAAEAMKAAATQQQRRAANYDHNILERAAHGDLRGHVVPAEGVEDLLDSPEAHAPEPTPETKGERDFHLITIRGKPLWIGVTLAVMALSVVSYLATRPDRDSVETFETWRSRLVEAGYFAESSDFASQILRGRRTAVRHFVHDANNPEKARIGLHTPIDDHDRIVAVTMSYLDEFLGGDKALPFTTFTRKFFITSFFHGLAGKDPLSLELRTDPDIDPEGGKVRGIHFGEEWVLEVIRIGDDTTLIIARQW